MPKTNFKMLRKNMVDGQIHPSGVVSNNILSSYEATPREIFVPEDLRGIAYSDEGISISQGRFLMEPITHSKMVQAVEPRSHDVVLDIASGSGYTPAILSPLVSTIVALESEEHLLQKAEQFWKKTKACNIVSSCSDITKGCSEHAPYSLIFFNGAVSDVPECILAQLANGGRLIAVIQNQSQTMGNVTLFQKSESGHLSSYELFSAGVASLPEFKPQPKFVFA